MAQAVVIHWDLFGHHDLRLNWGEKERRVMARAVRRAAASRPRLRGSSRKRKVRRATKIVLIPRRGVA